MSRLLQLLTSVEVCVLVTHNICTVMAGEWQRCFHVINERCHCLIRPIQTTFSFASSPPPPLHSEPSSPPLDGGQADHILACSTAVDDDGGIKRREGGTEATRI